MNIYNSYLQLTKSIIKNRNLIIEMAKQELRDKYVGQVFGKYWVFIHPIFLTGMYLFVFGVVYRQRIGGTYEMPLDFTSYILSGLVSWFFIMDALSKSCTIITINKTLIKQILFPLEILPLKSLLASLLPQLVTLLILIIYVLISNGSLLITYLLIPLLIFLEFTILIGVSYFLSIVGVFFKDMKDVVQLFITAGIYILPVVFLPQWVPSIFKPFIFINPFSHLVWCFQDALYFGRFEHPQSWIISFLMGFLSYSFGYKFFKKLQPYIGNVI